VVYPPLTIPESILAMVPMLVFRPAVATILKCFIAFSISLWAKTSNTTDQALLSGSTSGSANELIFWFDSITSARPHLNNASNGSITVSNFADNNWHHLVWTRSGTQNCLYLDKTLQGCVSLGGTNITLASNGLIIGQEQDSVGGSFVGSQAFDGLVDEILFYDSAISSAEITLIHDLQDAGKNLDGTDRSCPVENVTPVADWRFDENSWSGTDDVLDTSGNNYHGTAVNLNTRYSG
jgi:MSHA biogenesis protein MshQ